MPNKVTIEIGSQGSAYGDPYYLRGFSYSHQPNNEQAWGIGSAVSEARKMSSGDYIDSGLALLKTLEARGYGVFMLPKKGKEKYNAK